MGANERTSKIIYSRKIMNELLELGFSPIEILQNPLRPEFKCWMYARTPEFDAVLDKILSGYSKGGARNA